VIEIEFAADAAVVPELPQPVEPAVDGCSAPTLDHPVGF